MLLALPVAAFSYSKQFADSHWILSALLPAMGVEAACYLASVFVQTRNLLNRFRPARAQAAILWLSALIPYIIFSLIAGTFQRNAFFVLVGLTAVFSFWHAVFPRRVAYDLGFLVVAAAPLVTRAFPRIYLTPDSHVHVDILGHLMWIRVGIVALLVLRAWQPGSFGLWPSKKEWRSGFLFYCLAVVPVVLVAIGTKAVRWQPMTGDWWRVAGVAIATFFGFLWVTALSEELFFRGFVQRALLDRLPWRAAAVILSAAVFGSAHLWRHEFPDWRQAGMAAVLGIFCGIAYERTGSVKVPMVLHTLVVVTGRVLFR